MTSRGHNFQPRLARATQVVASALLVLAGVAGCAAAHTDPETDLGPMTEVRSETGPQAGTETGAVPLGLYRVTGRAVAVDDTGLPDTPMTDTTFVLLPAAVEDKVWAAAGTDPAEHQLPYLRASLGPTILAEGPLVETSARGEFAVDVAAGEHLLCRVGDRVEDDFRWTFGCAQVTVPGSGSWRVTAGEGGFHAADTDS